MQIKLEHIFFNDVKLKVTSLDKKVSGSFKTSLNFKSSLKKELSNNHFSIDFLINLKAKGFIFSVNSVAIFQTDKVLDETFLSSQFCKINAPAIAFPFIRTYISNTTLNSGFDPIILPSFNFVKIFQEENNNME
jgi:preprotein translocase subunit SecB